MGQLVKNQPSNTFSARAVLHSETGNKKSHNKSSSTMSGFGHSRDIDVNAHGFVMRSDKGDSANGHLEKEPMMMGN
jgi:hypothetical protein